MFACLCVYTVYICSTTNPTHSNNPYFTLTHIYTYTPLAAGLDGDNKALRDRIRALEENLDDERAERRAVEDRLSRQQAEADEKLRVSVTEWERKVREGSRKERLATESDWKDKAKSAERRAGEDLQQARDELKLSKARQEDMLKEMETLRKRVGSTKEDAALEFKLKLEKLQVSL